ncbi:hypothetical protein NC661_13535 [Aquibacillus koreensis]|uniref:Uncharacterized protein n=1 Tax=Aquibacillus koreensis TaxID=279446 RepID=A0A9X3WMA2_9BACI|nr:hypothetical protein [Aquibacillus koreensis]MCT2536254.1 hypothetical protein [Aquibacillus koreensis]MDC3421393.1 hypothetical protein [Aquibacillus koreensis]
MKNFIWIFTIIGMSVMLLGCSANEVIKVGNPFNDEGTEGVNFNNEITDEKAITELKTIIDNSKEIDKPNIENEAEVFFQLDRPDESVSEIRRYIWFQDDGSAVLFDGGSSYSTLTKEQTTKLKSILEL